MIFLWDTELSKLWKGSMYCSDLILFAQVDYFE